MAGIETPYFHCDPSVQNQIREKGKREKKTRENEKSKENTLIYVCVYIHTPGDKQRYINTDTHIHINPL